VNRFARISTVCVVLLLLSSPLFAQEPAAPGASAATAGQSLVLAGSAVGVGLTVIGAAYGIGRLAGSALESMARQPEVAGSIQTAMIIAAALIEGFTFFALYICMTKAL
jgi:F-type H+-transporting ATPase subunit c